MTIYPAVEALAAAHVRAAIAAGAATDAPAGVAMTARDDGVLLAGKRLGERWNVDPALRAIADAVRAAVR